jgi:hypothetical protein
MHVELGRAAFSFQNAPVMKTSYKKINRKHLSLGDLVAAVGSCSKSSRETLAALNDLFASGRVQIRQGHTLKRVRFA